MLRTITLKRVQGSFIRCLSTTTTKNTNNSPSVNAPETYNEMEIILAEPSQMLPKPSSPDELKFGHSFSDHMMEADWNIDYGWKKPIISPLHNFSIHPGAKVLHYAIELFEGMKAYRGVDNKIRLFRPEKNMERMKRTAIRASLPVSIFLKRERPLRNLGQWRSGSCNTPKTGRS
uniref:Branched-chain-amino-acid transaminase n=1 Tax=Panagrolaimus superbus TaxID=310955 RepID=A0A914Z908_9BILA